MLDIASEHGAEDISLPSPPTCQQAADDRLDQLLDRLWLAARCVVLEECEGNTPAVVVKDGAWWTLLTADVLGPDERTSWYIPDNRPPPEAPPDHPDHQFTPERLERIRAARKAALAAGARVPIYKVSPRPVRLGMAQVLPSTDADSRWLLREKPNHDAELVLWQHRNPERSIKPPPATVEVERAKKATAGLTALYYDGRDDGVAPARKPNDDREEDVLDHVLRTAGAAPRRRDEVVVTRGGKTVGGYQDNREWDSDPVFNRPPIEAAVAALHRAGHRLCIEDPRPRKKRTEHRDSTYNPACSDDTPHKAGELLDFADADDGARPNTGLSVKMAKKADLQPRRTKVDINREWRLRRWVAERSKHFPERFLEAVIGRMLDHKILWL